jgi:hypothetical protein
MEITVAGSVQWAKVSGREMGISGTGFRVLGFLYQRSAVSHQPLIPMLNFGFAIGD